jgi:phage repressor protein C with HTH and peptisase S24 domain
MFTHAQIWHAIDRIAADHALTPSGLARRAGLDATSFNKSKRINADGRKRWPSTESIAKILAVTGEPLEVFTRRFTGITEPLPGVAVSDIVADRGLICSSPIDGEREAA